MRKTCFFFEGEENKISQGRKLKERKRNKFCDGLAISLEIFPNPWKWTGVVSLRDRNELLRVWKKTWNNLVKSINIPSSFLLWLATGGKFHFSHEWTVFYLLRFVHFFAVLRCLKLVHFFFLIYTENNFFSSNKRLV